VRPAALVVVGGAVLLTWLVLMVASVWYFYEHWQAQLSMRNQAVRLRLPPGMVAMAEVDAPLRTHLSLQPLVRVPVRQTVSAQLSDQLQAQVRLDTVLPVDTSVTVDQIVPVRTTLSLSLKLRAWLPAIPVTVPVTLDLPVHMTVPVKAEVPVKLDIVASGTLPPALDIPIDAVFALRPRIDSDIQAKLLSQTAFQLVAPIAPFDVSIARADLSVPFNLTFVRQRRDR
jgi:hypothetical protein